MKIAFLFKRDSHFKAVKSTALRVCAQYKCEATFIGIDAEALCSHESCSIIYIYENDLSILSRYDYVIACLGGYLLNRTIAILKDTDTKVISIFPGIVSHYQLDAFISRLNADQVWLNSRVDFDLYSIICQLYKRKNNGLLYGMSWIDNCLLSNTKKIVKNPYKAVFFEQTEILSNNNKRDRFLLRINEIINMNPDVFFKYKIRNNVEDLFFTEIRKNLNCLPNVDVVNTLSEKDILESLYYLSISSSALIEGFLLGKNSYIIDWNLLDNDSKEFFKYSEIALSSNKLSDEKFSINNNWLLKRVTVPVKAIDLKSIDKINVTDCSITQYRSHNYIRFTLLKLGLKYRFAFNLVFKREVVCSIQKALEYLEMNNERK